MNSNSNNGNDILKTAYYAGSGSAIGAALGMIFGYPGRRSYTHWPFWA